MSKSRSTRSSFIDAQRVAQGKYFDALDKDTAGYLGSPYRLAPANRALNFAPSIRNEAGDYFGRHQITWHIHASHGLSSQACCLNFLMPLATRPDLLSKVIGRALGIEPAPKMLVVEKGAFSKPWYVGFEWIGTKNYLGEWPSKGEPTRGANVTSADAVVRFRHEGRDETLLIEWKYTERYGSGIPDKRSPDGLSGGNLTRAGRYAGKVFDPDGPIRDDLNLKLDDFFFEPFYQLLRQQTLAWRMEREDGERVRVLHISPHGNLDLHAVTSPPFAEAGHTDAFDAFKSVLVAPRDGVPRLIDVRTEDLFGPILAETPADPWADYLLKRYDFMTRALADGLRAKKSSAFAEAR